MLGWLEMSEQPEPFSLNFQGPDGLYEASFVPDGDEGHLIVRGVGSEELRWGLYICDRTPDGWELGSISHGTQHVWGEAFWFSLFTGPAARIEYWGNQVHVRTDPAVL